MASTYSASSEVTTTTVPSFTVSLSSNGKQMTFTETTGIYDASTNPDGWDAVHAGGDGASIDQITESYMRITTPAGVEYDVDMSGANPYTNMPGAAGTGSFTIDMSDLGSVSTAVFPDGVYVCKLLYKIADADLSPNPGFIPPTVVNGVALSISEGYVHTLLAQLKPGCTCKNTDFETAKLGWMYLKAAAYSATCGKYDKVNDYINQIAKITGNTTGCISC